MCHRIVATLCLALVMTSQVWADDRVVVLTGDRQLALFDLSGQKLSVHKLAGPPATYTAITIGDFDLEQPGNELAILRTDQHVDLYPLPTAGMSMLKRLSYTQLQPIAGRKTIDICASDSYPEMPGDEVVALQAAETDADLQYAHVYSIAGEAKVSKRLAYFALKPSHGALRTIASSASGGVLTLSDDGHLETFAPRTNIWRRTSTAPLPEADRLVSADSHGEQTLVMTHTAELLRQVEGEADEFVTLPLAAPPIDFAVYEPVATAVTPAVEGAWRSGQKKNERLSVWPALPGDLATPVAVQTPDGAGRGLELISPHAPLRLPVNLQLPQGTNSVGFWFQDASGLTAKHQSVISKEIAFVVRVDGMRQRMLAHQIDSPTYVRPGRGFHPIAKYGDWILWQVYWEPDADGQPVLESVEIAGGPEKTIRVGPVRAGVNRQRPYAARDVWKLKNISKQGTRVTSLHHTGEKQFEYTFQGAPLLRPVLWRERDPAEVRVVVRSTLGVVLEAYRLAGPTLQEAFALPDLPEGSYFIELCLLGEGHRFLDSQRLVLQRLQGDSRVPRAEGQAASGLVPCRLENRVASGPMGQAGTPVVLQFRLAADLAGLADTCRWRLEDNESVPVSHGRTPISQAEALAVQVPAPRAGGYKLLAAFYSAQGVKLYERWFPFGVGEPDGGSHTPPEGEIFKEDGRALMLSSINTSFDVGQTFRLPQYTLPALMSASRKGGNQLVLPLGWYMYEPVKGVYNDYLVDRLLEMGSAGGDKTWLGVGFGGDGLPEWLWYEDYLAQDNRTVNHPYHYVTPMGERFSTAHADLYRRLFERYKDDPRVAGWFYYAGPSEGFLTDCWTRIGDYSMPAKRRFRADLQNRYDHSLDKLNAAWGSTHSSWEDIQPPIPDFTKAWEDTPQWRDFVDFKQDFVVQRLTELQGMLREIDADRPALMYAKEGFGATGALAPIFKKHRVRYSNGGGETVMSYVQSSIMNNFGVPVTCEGHWVMPQPGSVFTVMANAILAGRFGGNNLMWGLVWTKRQFDQTPRTEMIMQATRAISEVADELNTAVQAGPRWAGYYSSATSLYTGRQFRLGLNPTLLSIHDAAQKQLHTQESWVDDFTPVEILATYPLLVDADSRVMTAKSVENMLSYVDQGGVLIASLTMGQYLPGQAEPVYQMAEYFGARGIQKCSPDRGAAANSDLGVVVRARHEIVGDAGRLQILATDGMGAPLLWEAEHGKGKVIFSAGPIIYTKSNNFLKSTLAMYAGQTTLQIDADASVQAGTVVGEDAYYVVIRPVMPKNNVNASIEQMQALEPVHVRMTGSMLNEQVTVRECVWGARLQRTAEDVAFDATPGTLYLIRIAKH